MARVVIIGSGAGGSIAAMAFAEAGWETLILERGPNRYIPVGGRLSAAMSASPIPAGGPDAVRVFTHRTSAQNLIGPFNALPQVVGGATTHWDAKTPRFWDIDFKKRTLLGDVADAWIDDWPFDYAELSAYYDAVEEIVGVQGDVSRFPAATLAHAPRRGALPMPAGRPQQSSQLLARAADALGWYAFPVPMAANSTYRNGRPACTDCGDCCGFACASGARSGAIAPLRRAQAAGARICAGHRVSRIAHRNGRATGVECYVGGEVTKIASDFVVVAASAIETVRLALISDLPNPRGLIGAGMMFHAAAIGVGTVDAPLDTLPGRHYTHAMDEFADPAFAGAARAARAAGLPYLRGGTVELGTDARALPGDVGSPWAGTDPARILLTEMHAEDLAQPHNRVRLAHHHDSHGLPVAHVTYASHPHEIVAHEFYAGHLCRLLELADAAGATVSPRLRLAPSARPLVPAELPNTHHTMGGMRMSADASRRVVDANGIVDGLDNVAICDGAVFPTSAAHNPTLTIMATSLRTAAAVCGWRWVRSTTRQRSIA